MNNKQTMDNKTKLLKEIENIVIKGNSINSNKLNEKLNEKLRLYFELGKNIFEIKANIDKLKNLIKKYKNDFAKFVIEEADFFIEQLLEIYSSECLDHC
ncbi:MAG: hypothetical protein NZZ41_07985 [Candidatus Dojkabacteria bacterium]|nr:hypothetical protein [Candidatus Dojkabacteria bacterium]